MLFSTSSVFITLIMSTIMILLFNLLIVQKKCIRFLKMDIMILLALVITVRLIFPFEFFFTITIPFPLIMNGLKEFFEYRVFLDFTILQCLCFIWITGTCMQALKYLYSMKKCYRTLYVLQQEAEHRSVTDYLKIDSKYNYKVWISPKIDSPMVIGLKKIILLPKINLPASELQEILKHEIQHIRNHDNFIKQVINILKIIYWWFPPLYWFSNQMQLALEMRVDQQVTKGYTKSQVYDYASVLIKLKQMVIKQQNLLSVTLPLSSNFLIGDHEKVLSYRIHYLLESNYRKKTSFLLLFIILLLPFISNSIVLEAYFPPPLKNYTSYPANAIEESFILEHKNGSYSLFVNGTLTKINDPNNKKYSNLPVIKESDN